MSPSPEIPIQAAGARPEPVLVGPNMHVIEIRCSSNPPNLNLPTLIRSLHWPAGTVECPGKEVVLLHLKDLRSLCAELGATQDFSVLGFRILKITRVLRLPEAYPAIPVPEQLDSSNTRNTAHGVLLFTQITEGPQSAANKNYGKLVHLRGMFGWQEHQPSAEKC